MENAKKCRILSHSVACSKMIRKGKRRWLAEGDAVGQRDAQTHTCSACGSVLYASRGPGCRWTKKFAGAWEANSRTGVKVDEQVSGEMAACHMNVDGNGDLQEPDDTQTSDKPSHMVDAPVSVKPINFTRK